MTRYTVSVCPGCGRRMSVNGSTCRPATGERFDVTPMADGLTTEGRRPASRRSPEGAPSTARSGAGTLLAGPKEAAGGQKELGL